MNAAVVLAVIFGGMLGPLLVAAMITDLTRNQVIMLAVVALVIAGYIASEHSDAMQALYWRWTMPAQPPAETAFIKAAVALRVAREKLVSNPANARGLREAETTLCALPATADDWVGRVEQTYLNNSGEGASLVVTIWPRVVVRSAFFADNTDTLIRAGSPLFPEVTTLRSGDTVHFSGQILGHSGACPGDPPVDRNEKLRDPEFLVRYTALKKQDG